LAGTLADLRRVVERSTTLVTFTPGATGGAGAAAWDDAETRAHGGAPTDPIDDPRPSRGRHPSATTQERP
ncbi:MAG: hypothetical protein J0H73_00945, partial [Salana multivorans]|nr:hypothetical protein [Salana multivorans]